MAAKKVTVSYLGKDTIFEIDNPADYIQNHIAENKTFYEIDMLRDIRDKTAGRRPVIVDAGAYIGNHSLFFAMHCNAIVHSFEPFDTSFESLKKNISLNTLNDSVVTHNVALGDAITEAKMYVADKKNAGMNRIVSTEPGDTHVTTLDIELLNNVNKVDVIKIDVEGMEVNVLRGAMGIIKRDWPILYVEAFEEERLALIKGILLPLGYVIDGVFNNTPTYLFVKRNNSSFIGTLKKLFVGKD